MRAKWRSPRRAGSSVLKKALDTPNIVRDGRITLEPYRKCPGVKKPRNDALSWQVGTFDKVV